MGFARGELVDRGTDGQHLDVADPDGITVRFLTAGSPDAPRFAGVVVSDGEPPTFYTVPRLLPPDGDDV